MNKALKITLIVVGVLVVVGGAVFAGFWFGRGRALRASGGPVVVAPGAMMNPGLGRQPGFGPGGMKNRGFGPGGMFGNRGGRGGFGFGPGRSTANLQPVTQAEAAQAAQKFVDGLGVSGLKLDPAVIIGDSAYVVVREESSGLGAFELTVDPASKTAHALGGADTLWNLKYGAVVASKAGRNAAAAVPTPATVAADMPVTADQAVKLAQDYLDKGKSGDTAQSGPIQFYGYYTVEISKDGKVTGLIGVNGYNGEVFPGLGNGMFFGRP